MKTAFVGCAHIHTPAFVEKVNQRADRIQVAAVWDHDPARAAANAEKLHSTAVASPDAIWNDRSIESVIICSETNLHKDLIRQAAHAGKHIYAEKPLGFSADDALRSAAEIEKNGKLFQTGYFMRGIPVYRFLKKQVENGAFGTITRARFTNCHQGSLAGWFDTEWRWMADPAIAGCGAFGDLGTHSLDLLLWYFGMPKQAFASIHTLTERYGKECDEYGEGMLIYPNGMVVTIAAGWVDCMNPIPCEICGTKGHAVVMNDQVYFQSELVPGSSMKEPVKDLPEELPHAFDLFLDALEGKKVPLIPVRDAAMRNVVMGAMYQSAKTGLPENINI